MTQFGEFVALIGVTAVALAIFGAVVAWYNQEGRRIRRGLRRVLKGDTHALILAYGRGRGAGFNFTSNTMAVAWDTGAWCLIYRIDELIGVELIIDGQVAGRAFRSEKRRPVDILGGAEKQVVLRLVFDDPHYADFPLELWNAARPVRRGELNADEAAEEGNRWLARIESIFRRTRNGQNPRAEAEPEPDEPPRAAAPPPEPAHPPAPTPGDRQELPFDEDDTRD